MTSRSWLTARRQSIVDVLTPKIAESLLDKKNSQKIDLATAESHLIRKEVVEIYRAAIIDNLNCDALSYPSQLGGEQYLREAIAGFFNQIFQPNKTVLPDHIVVGPGVTACLTSVLCSICKSDDAVLIPGSYWSGFDLHLKLLPDIQLVNAMLEDPSEDELGPSMISSLIATATSLDKNGKTPKAVILTNPHNPTGRCYSVDVLKSLAKFCEDHDLHLIVDEIYATSQCRQPHADERSFKSFLSLDLQSLGVDAARVHIIWGTSKDFGSSGIRVGCFVSQDNPQVRMSVALSTTTQLSSLATIATAALLTSPDLPRLMLLNTTRLELAYNETTAWMIRYGITYIPALYGMYILARLAPDVRTWQEEEDLVQSLNNAGVAVLPGRSFHLREPGWVRITIAVLPHVLSTALSIMTVALKLKPHTAALKETRGSVYIGEVDAMPSVNQDNAESKTKASKRKVDENTIHDTRVKKLRLQR